MNEVFLALTPEERIGGPLNLNEPGMCSARWIYDKSLIIQFINSGWTVYRVNSLEKVTEVLLELKMEK